MIMKGDKMKMEIDKIKGNQMRGRFIIGKKTQSKMNLSDVLGIDILEW